MGTAIRARLAHDRRRHGNARAQRAEERTKEQELAKASNNSQNGSVDGFDPALVESHEGYGDGIPGDGIVIGCMDADTCEILERLRAVYIA